MAEMADAASELVTLAAEAPFLTEVTVCDHRFQLVGRGSSPLELQLPPGAYVVQFKLGASMREVSAILRPGSQRVVIEAPKLDLSSPAPLSESTAAHYRQFAQERSLRVDLSPGSGGQLFLFARAARADRERSDLTPLFDIVVGDSTGTPVVSFKEAAHRAPDGFSAALNLEVAPGAYLVRYGAGDAGYLEQTIVVSEGWQTQLFTSSRIYSKGESEIVGPNLPDAAVFIAPMGAGFRPDKPAFINADSARQALREDIALVPEQRVREVSRDIRVMAAGRSDRELREMARDKFDNPILGLYAAHLLLLRPKRDWDFLREVVGNLRRLLGDHPDVLAFGVFPEVDLGTRDIARGVPPMLRSSWKMLVSASTKEPDLIPCESYAGIVADRMWGRGTWQVWRAPSAGDLAKAPTESRTEEGLRSAMTTLRRYAMSNIRSEGAARFAAKVASDRTLSSQERLILLQHVSSIQLGKLIDQSIQSESGIVPWLAGIGKSWLERFSWADFVTGSGSMPSGVEKDLSPEKIARSVNAPYSAVSASLTSLARKIAERTPS